MKVVLIARTHMNYGTAIDESDGKWKPEVGEYESFDDASQLTEFSGRQCYESWEKPNPATATNIGYIGNIIDQAHFSVMEHGTMTFRVSDVSRSLTHELVRHRHLSFSQLSQRYVQVDKDNFVVPPLYRDSWENNPTDPIGETQGIILAAWRRAVEDYDALVAIWMPRLIRTGYTAHQARKMAREAARSVLPNMTPTAIVVTGNHRSWREFLTKRGTIHADAEIRELAVALFEILRATEPAMYQDFVLEKDPISGHHVIVNEPGGVVRG
jgi:thymidylate synthase (FAD)